MSAGLNNGQSGGVIRAIAYRPTDGDPMVETDECRVLVGRGLETENRKPGKREVTFLSTDAWADAGHDLRAELPWHIRRANLLVEGFDLASTVGQTLSIGKVGIKIHGESKPCQIMEQQHPGLRAALVPECRGGVFGQVLTGGTIRMGDSVEIVRE